MIVGVPSWIVETIINLCYDTPVHHVVRLKNLHTDEVEVGGYHIVFLAYTNNIRIAEVGGKDGIDVGAVKLVTPQLLDLCWCF